MRLSDILRTKHPQKNQALETQSSIELDTPVSKEPSYKTAGGKRETQEHFSGNHLSVKPALRAHAPHSVLSQVHSRTKQNSAVQVKEIYGNLIQIARNFLSGYSKDPDHLPDLEEMCESIERTIELFDSKNSTLLELIERSTPDDYLPGHVVNVAILSIAVSRQLNWPKEIQRSVGVGALLHDAGMVYHRPEYSKTQLSSTDERHMLRKFPEEGLKIMKEFLDALAPESKKIVENIILQSQERISGEGHPYHLKGDLISKEAQVVGLCDAYEAIGHPRPYRSRRLPHDTLKYLIELSGDLFDGNLIKALWETLSLFPPGSFVKLSTNEIAKVIDLNKKLPTRPVVKVIISSAGEKVKSAKLIDLSQTPGIAIQKAVDECSLDIADKRLTLELRAQKWWVR